MHSAARQFRPLLLLAALLAASCAAAAPEKVLPERFLSQVAAQLAAHFGVNGDLQLDLQRSWTAPIAPSADWEMTVVVPPQALAAQIIVRVRLTESKRSLGEWNLPLRAQLWGDSLVARQPIARGQPLDASLFDFRRTDFIREKDAISAGAELANLEIARGVGAGSTLLWRDVSRRLLVQRGSRIEVVAVDGALAITMKGLAMQSGAMGETIVVRNPESRRDFSAVVTAANQARVSF